MHQNDQTQEQFLPSGNPSNEHLTLNVEHTIHYLFTTYLFFHFKFVHIRPVHIIVYIIYCVFAILYIAYLYICILLFYYMCPVLLLSFCCTVELLSLKQIPHMCKHTWPIKLILILKHLSLISLIIYKE